MQAQSAVSGVNLEPTLVQDWSAYSEEQHEVWRILYERRMRLLEHTASNVFLDGAEIIGLSQDVIPDLSDVNERLSGRTGWRAVPVGGFLPAPEFFASLAVRRFPTTITIRPKDRIDYVTAPDIFHDVFGHVPLHSNPTFADFLQGFGKLASHPRADTEAMARLFWFTVEFGLIREGGEVKIYGSGLISSGSDAANALGPSCDRRPFSLSDVLAQPFRIDELQKTLFVLESFDQLFEAVDTIGAGKVS